MKPYNYLIVVLAAVMIMSCASLVFAQDEKQATPAAAETAAVETAAPAPAPAPEAPQAKEIAIYGEIQSVDAAGGKLAVQYYDYDSDSEKTATVVVDKDSKIENAGSLNDIKKGDWADVTYVLKGDNNIAKLVTVEKEEVAATEPAAPAAAESETE
jgi:hypothetical protein